MKTRSQLYADEKEILNILSFYRVLLYEQIYKFLPNKSIQAVDGMLRRLKKGKRLYINEESRCVYYSQDLMDKADTGILKSVWLLLEFFGKITYHTNSSYPADIFFITGTATFEIIQIKFGEETAVNSYFLGYNRKDDTKRIIIVDDVSQIPNILVPNTAGYCTVSHDGQINYFKY